MTWEGWFTLAIVVALIYGLTRNWAADLLTMAALALILAAGTFSNGQLPSVEQGIAGFGNSAMLTVAVLFVVVAGLVQTGAMARITRPMIGQPKSELEAQARVLFPVIGLSAFLNNTPVVAMFMPVVDDVCKKHNLSPSKLFLPLSYASTFGGCCTLIGTSTNIIVSGLMVKAGLGESGMFGVTWLGVPAAVAAMAFILFSSRWLLPDRKPAISLSDDPRQYTVEMIVQRGGPLVGQSIEAAGLRHLPGLFLAEIERQGEILPAVGPTERLQADDRLIFVGIVESVVDLQKYHGLQPATNQVFKLNDPRTQRCLIEAVVSDRCPIVGKTIRDGQFRTRYDAAVLAVARSGERIQGKIGDIVLKSGDTLLLEAHRSFEQRMRNSPDFFLVSSVQNSSPPRHEKAILALLILAAMVVANVAGWFDVLTAAMLAAGLMIVTRCCTGREARESIDLSVLVVIGASFGIGKAMEVSGAAQFIADQLIGAAKLFGGHPWLVLAAIYATTMILTELITNNAAAVLMFPIGIAAASSLDVSAMPFVMSIMVGSSAGFATPMGYQCNMMVMGPGGYRFSDYLRIGVPLDLLYMAVTVGLAPVIWPFRPVM